MTPKPAQGKEKQVESHPEENNKSQNWESLDKGFMSLFVYVTADGWSDLQAELDEGGHIGSRLFSASFLFVGHFIFINLFIGVVIQNIEAASEGKRHLPPGHVL